jgi:hypothetical protein
MMATFENHEDLTSIIKEAIGDEHNQTKLMNNGITKVNVSRHYAYKILTNSLKINHILWFSYENKQNRNVKVMVKNLHHSYQPVRIRCSHNNQDQVQNASFHLFASRETYRQHQSP